MYWLITFSRTIGDIVTSMTTPSHLHPGEFFLALERDYPQTVNKLLFAIEIKEEHYHKILHEWDK